MPSAGDVLLYKNYEFEDGSKRNKLFVVLNDISDDTPCLVFKTTSQSKRYSGATKGCNIKEKVFFIPITWQDCFDVDTYVQLPQIIEFSTIELLQHSMVNRRVEILNSITPGCLAQLKNCIKNFRDDISPRHWKFIF